MPERAYSPDTAPFESLVRRGIVSQSDLEQMETAWLEQGIHPEVYLRQRLKLTRAQLREALTEYTGLPSVAYDERLPVPEDLVRLAYQAEGPARGDWFPLGRERDVVVFAVRSPRDEAAMAEIEELFPGRPRRLMVCLKEEIGWYAQDFALRDEKGAVGVQRTAMAYWRNIMALWRTKLACQRTNLASGRTWLNIMRWSLGIVAMGNSLLRLTNPTVSPVFAWMGVAAGFVLASLCFASYLRLARTWRHSSDQTLVEATSAVLHFLEDYHFLDMPCPPGEPDRKKTMLGRLADCLGGYSTLAMPRGGYRERITLARERNVLAAQRTVLACYRTLAARARTGLAFFRTGVTIASLGLGLLSYFALSPLSLLDGLLILSGVAMVADGAAWYLPVRKEHAETPRCVWFDQNDHQE